MKRDLPNDGELLSSQLVHIEPMPSPDEVRSSLPLTDRALTTVLSGRHALSNILDGHDPRLAVIVGPCSIHDTVAGLDYARRLKALADELASRLYLVMRVYFEKPRTSIGWKGLINDPHMDGSCQIAEGMARARRFLLDVNELGLPAATEALDPLSPHYLSELVSWTAIGARTTESQTHREMSSGLAMPVGFKNGTDGNVDTAVNAIIAAGRSQAFLGIDPTGRAAVLRTPGNRYAHLVLRGGGGRPNYDSVSVTLAEQALQKAGQKARIVVDCAHANSWKKQELQAAVLTDVVHQRQRGNRSITGVMIESFIEPGNQSIPADLSQLRYGCSVTDSCVGWADTEAMLRKAYAALGA
ncbi:3-deoxy-7-phosphoheptulonate synthase [Chitinimonas sp. BJB300]|uniref:3-deoxy-7-phosphoheptulonate synthase n=1 Tax=Chitinimonas sp. BJB300 TaxID=1559339 RepID=UPI000C0E021D|nr:3-deoxy-7-phosphoheptulonate synthase [Chitinimonas sp. BJB300]PHV11869.1 3-deoxy-7-phosphoheptulonate synthase [Chitinimonas sp. BJB300]TSJ87770.1 3-deoxy-7-phosphoheptulonate synthase [Chitinimonas sp. BJB300]